MSYSRRKFIKNSTLAAGSAFLVGQYSFEHALQAGPMVSISSPSGWWMTEPIRLLQTNLREIDSTLDTKRLGEQLSAFSANALLFNMGGIVAQYPTKVDFHYASPYLPPGRDLFGEMLQEAHGRDIRIIGRFDLSKTQKPVFEARPEWFFKRTNGEPVIYNGLYSACINGDYYRQHSKVILTEALQNYPVDGLFFNMFGNPSHDYSGNPMGPCQCNSCKERFQQQYGRALPKTPDQDYRDFMRASSHEVAALLADLIHSLRPEAAFLTYIQERTDGIMSESNTAVGRPLPLWPYSASDNVNRARNSEPEKMAFNLCMSFVDYQWRFVTVPPGEISLRLYQNMAHGAPLALAMVGTMDQEDRHALLAAQPIFQWQKEHEELQTGTHSAARVLLLRGDQNSYRGFFRLLSEQHIPFAVSDNLKWLDDPNRQFDLVIAPSGTSPELEKYVKEGGRLLIAGPSETPFSLGRLVKKHPHTKATWRIRNHDLFPSLEKTNLIFLDGEFMELAPIEEPLLSLIPPAMFGPPEKVWVDKEETKIPGIVFSNQGKGRVGWIPWDVGGLYYLHSSPGHSGLMIDSIDHLLPNGRQVKTNAHPLVEITILKQPQQNRTLVHFVNISGHSSTAYFKPLTMGEIEVELNEGFTKATAMGLKKDLDVISIGSNKKIILPELSEYEVVVLE